MLAPRAKWIRAALVIAAISVGCSSKKDDKDRPEPPPQNDTKTDAKAAPTPTADARTAAGDGDGDTDTGGDPFATIGVEPCDDYINRQKACVENHAPDGIKDQQLDGLAHIATRWRRAAAAGATDHLVNSCSSLLSASADATAAWTCKW